jgi:hypothetical protein
MPALMNLLLRLVLLAAGLVFAASLAFLLLVGLALWSVRAVVARLLGRPVSPFVVRVHPRQAFRKPARRFPTGGDVTDVEIKSSLTNP